MRLRYLCILLAAIPAAPTGFAADLTPGDPRCHWLPILSIE